jgi:hypothetical protein
MTTELQNICYALRVWPDTVTDFDDEVKILIAKTLLKLPEEVREDVLENVTFVFLSMSIGLYIESSLMLVEPGEVSHFIFLNFTIA